MNKCFSVFMGIFIAIGLCAVYGQSAANTSEQDARINWVKKCLLDFNKINGMKRSEVEKSFPQDGGLQFIPFVRYLHPECNFFKVDVYYDFKRDANDHNCPISSPDDLVTNISLPYIESPAWE